jgi:hypothetical protein
VIAKTTSIHLGIYVVSFLIGALIGVCTGSLAVVLCTGSLAVVLDVGLGSPPESTSASTVTGMQFLHRGYDMAVAGLVLPQLGTLCALLPYLVSR